MVSILVCAVEIADKGLKHSDGNWTLYIDLVNIQKKTSNVSIRIQCEGEGLREERVTVMPFCETRLSLALDKLPSFCNASVMCSSKTFYFEVGPDAGCLLDFATGNCHLIHDTKYLTSLLNNITTVELYERLNSLEDFEKDFVSNYQPKESCWWEDIDVVASQKVACNVMNNRTVPTTFVLGVEFGSLWAILACIVLIFVCLIGCTVLIPCCLVIKATRSLNNSKKIRRKSIAFWIAGLLLTGDCSLHYSDGCGILDKQVIAAKIIQRKQMK